jgi:hypothetical protein
VVLTAAEVVLVMRELPRWLIEQDDAGCWRWTRTDASSRTVSSCAFARHAECVLDAIRHALKRRRHEEEGQTH